MENFGKRMMMTLVGGLALLFVAACGTVPSDEVPSLQLKQAIAGVYTPGDVTLTGAYCVGVDIAFMKTFTAMLVQYGTHGYWDFIEQKGVPCYDSRMKRVKTKFVRALLLERMWEFDLYEGSRYTMWKVKDRKGNVAYTWNQVEGQET